MFHTLIGGVVGAVLGGIVVAAAAFGVLLLGIAVSQNQPPNDCMAGLGFGMAMLVVVPAAGVVGAVGGGAFGACLGHALQRREQHPIERLPRW